MTCVLDYESALLTAVFDGFVMPPVWVALSRRTGNNTLLFWPQWTALGLALSSIPLAFLLVSTLFICPYGILDGLLFWLLYPVCTVLFTATVFPSLAQFFRKKRHVVFAVFIPWLFLAWSLIRLYQDPPVFLYDPFFGFFSGAFYDRYIDLLPSFFATRAMHIAAAFLIIAIAAGRANILPKRPAGILASTGALLAIGLYVFGPELGMRFSHAQLQRAMGKHLDTEHFRIVYSPQIEESRIHLMAVEAEWHREELIRFFGTAPVDRITVYLFADEEEKRRFFGTRDVEVAKPWQNAVYITDNGFPHPSLRHELAHVFAAVWGDPWFGVAWTFVQLGPLRIPLPDPGIIEGIAQAASADSEDENLHAQARLLQEMGGFVSFETLFSPAFYSVNAARAYTQVGSFFRYLYETQGFEPLRRLYREGGPLTRVFPDLAHHWNEYQQFLATVQIPDYRLALTRERFLRPPIHRQRCVHAVARARHRAAACAAQKKTSCAIKSLAQAHRMDPDNLETWMLHLMIVRHLQGAQTAQKAAIHVLALAGEATHLRVRAHIVQAEAAWLADDVKTANSHLKQAAAIVVPPAVHREIVLLQKLLDFSTKMPFIKTWFTQPIPAWLLYNLLERSGTNQYPVFLYLSAGLALSLGRWQDAAHHLENLDITSLPDDFFRCEALYRRFLVALLLRQFSTAQMHLQHYEHCSVQEHNANYYRSWLHFVSQSSLQWSKPQKSVVSFIKK